MVGTFASQRQYLIQALLSFAGIAWDILQLSMSQWLTITNPEQCKQSVLIFMKPKVGTGGKFWLVESSTKQKGFQE